MSSKFIHIVADVRIFFPFKDEEYSVVCVYHILLICLSIGGSLGCFYVLALVNILLMNMDVYLAA